MNEIIWIYKGENRPPRCGEWFRSPGEEGYPTQANFDFQCQSFDIVYQHIIPTKDLAHIGDPCQYCGIPHNDVPVGICMSRKRMVMNKLEEGK